MKRFSSVATLAVLVSAQVFGGISSQPANAAVITWGTPTTISGTTDVNTAGTLYAASSFSNSAYTVNGVTFAAWSPAPSGSGTKTVGNFTLQAGAQFQFNAGTFGSTSNPFNALPSEYKNLLSGAIVSNVSTTLTITGLTSGTTYAIQFWGNESRAAQATRTQTVDGITLDLNTTNAGGGVGQWISGTFTANSGTQNFTIAGADTYLNAVQVRIVPEPETLAGLGVIGGCLTGMLRRRFRAAKSAS